MADAPERWTEQRLYELVPYELDSQEFKSSLYVWDGTPGGAVRNDFIDNLSKQVSAFANAGGGRLFLGIDDRARVDGGVPIDLRTNGTREWLEDVVPGIVDPPLSAFNVHEVLADDPHRTAILPGRAVYVIELPDSDGAPHQARDRRYYLRIAGKSRPMSHRHVLDILQRRRDPEVLVEQIDPYGEPELLEHDPRGPSVLLRLRCQLVNRGRALAHHVGLECTLPRFAVTTECRRRTLAEHADAKIMQRPGEVTYFFYHPIPIFPQQCVPFGVVWVALHNTNLAHYQQGRVALRWRVYADAALRREGQVDVSGYSAVQRALKLARSSASSEEGAAL